MLNNLLFKQNPFFKPRGIRTFKQSFNVSVKLFSQKINKTRRDYYEILGIPKSATEEEIKAAYRNLAKRYHPDVNISASTTHQPDLDKFRDIADAYAVLSNKTLRLEYDMRIRNFPNEEYSPEK